MDIGAVDHGIGVAEALAEGFAGLDLAHQGFVHRVVHDHVIGVHRSGARLRGDLVVACVAGETQGGEGTHALMERGLRTDAAVVAEPFGADHLVTVHSGIVHLAIHTYGVTGHIGRLEGTVNAVHKMTGVIEALSRVRFRHTPRPDLPAFPRLNVGGIIGGRGQEYVLVEPPYVPDLCTIMVDVHFVPGQTVDDIIADIRAGNVPGRCIVQMKV